MKTAKLTLIFLACAAASTAFAQNTTDSRCGTTNFDKNQNMFTIASPTPGTANQQCFVTVVSKASWTGGVPDLASSQLVEGNYEVALSGGGGGGGGGGGSGRETEHGRTRSGTGGEGGGSAIPVTTVRYLTPGVYRLTIGSGGQGGTSNGGHGADGAPTSLSNAYSGETVAGFSRAESWDGSYPQTSLADNRGGKGLTAIAYSPAKSGERGANGGSGGAGGRDGDRGVQGGNGFIKLALKDSVPQAAPAISSSSETVITPAPAAARPARRDRN
jgi:hypothetical protein